MIRTVRVFFYGTFMDRGVLEQCGAHPAEVVAAKLSGFEIVIGPRVNLVPLEHSTVYGSIAALTHEDLERLYSDLHARYGLKYQPEAVLAETSDGTQLPALCYLASSIPPGDPDPTYLKSLAQCIRRLGHPEPYAKRIESFLPESA